MCEWVTALTAAISPLAVAGVALGSQWIQCREARKEKELEVIFTRKADVYQRFAEKAGSFAMDPKNEGKYQDCLASIYAAVLVGSEQVADLLRHKKGVDLGEIPEVTMAAVKLRGAVDEKETEGVLVREFTPSMERTVAAMRTDLMKVSK